MDDIAAASVKQAAEIEKRSANVDVRDIYVPMLVRTKRLDKASALLARLFVPLL